jgi:hypothetical protein
MRLSHQAAKIFSIIFLINNIFIIVSKNLFMTNIFINYKKY